MTNNINIIWKDSKDWEHVDIYNAIIKTRDVFDDKLVELKELYPSWVNHNDTRLVVFARIIYELELLLFLFNLEEGILDNFKAIPPVMIKDIKYPKSSKGDDYLHYNYLRCMFEAIATIVIFNHIESNLRVIYNDYLNTKPPFRFTDVYTDLINNLQLNTDYMNLLQILYWERNLIHNNDFHFSVPSTHTPSNSSIPIPYKNKIYEFKKEKPFRDIFLDRFEILLPDVAQLFEDIAEKSNSTPEIIDPYHKIPNSEAGKPPFHVMLNP